jgi:hypothetical protein
MEQQQFWERFHKEAPFRYKQVASAASFPLNIVIFGPFWSFC